MDLQEIFDDFNLNVMPDDNINPLTPLTSTRPSENERFFDIDANQQLLPLESQILQYILDKAANELLILNQGFNQDSDMFLIKSSKFAEKFQDVSGVRKQLQQTSDKMQRNPLDTLNIKIRNDM